VDGEADELVHSGSKRGNARQRICRIARDAFHEAAACHSAKTGEGGKQASVARSCCENRWPDRDRTNRRRSGRVAEETGGVSVANMAGGPFYPDSDSIGPIKAVRNGELSSSSP